MPDINDDRKRIAVAGAGIVGIMTARKLQQAGHEVFLFDPCDPASQCSFGNAGYIAIEEVLPMARPAILRKAPGMLLRPSPPVAIRAADMPWLMPWFLRFAQACRPDQVARGTRALTAIMGRAKEAWLGEVEASHLQRFWRERGMIRLHECPAEFASSQAELNVMRNAGVHFEVLTRPAIEDRLPGIKPGIDHAVWYSDGAHVTDPQGIARAIFDAFIHDGGDFIPQPVTSLVCARGAVRSVKGTSAEVPVDAAVITAGQGAPALMRELGIKTPMVAERGYHLVMDCLDVPFDLPLTSAKRGFILTPMDMGLRLAGTVEFGRASKPETWKRADVLARHLKALFPDLEATETSRWMGERPTLPDFLPAIGRAPGYPNLYCGYGHQHFGLTQSAITGEIIAELIAGREPSIDLAAFDPGRFS